MVVAGIYLLTVIFSLIEYVASPPAIMAEFALLILTAPCSFLLLELFESLGSITNENGDSLIYVLVIFGGLINVSILYLLGLFLSKIWSLVSWRKDS